MHITRNTIILIQEGRHKIFEDLLYFAVLGAPWTHMTKLKWRLRYMQPKHFADSPSKTLDRYFVIFSTICKREVVTFLYKYYCQIVALHFIIKDLNFARILSIVVEFSKNGIKSNGCDDNRIIYTSPPEKAGQWHSHALVHAS